MLFKIYKMKGFIMPKCIYKFKKFASFDAIFTPHEQLLKGHVTILFYSTLLLLWGFFLQSFQLY